MRATFAGKVKDDAVWVGDIAKDGASAPAPAAALEPRAVTRKILQSPRLRSLKAHPDDKTGDAIGELLRYSLFPAGRGADEAGNSNDATGGRKLNCRLRICKGNEGNEGKSFI